MKLPRSALAGALALAALFAPVGVASAQRQDARPVRTWSFAEVELDRAPAVVAGDRQQGGRLSERHEFGPAVIEFTEPPDGIAEGEIFSSATGGRYGVLAESPSFIELGPGAEGPPVGGYSKLEQEQSYEKRADDATLEFTISEALVKAIDENGPVLGANECAAGRVCRPIVGIVRFVFRVYAESAADDLFTTKGVAFIHGHAGDWTIEAATLPDAQVPLWDNDRFTRDFDSVGGGNGEHAEAYLTEPLTVDVDLSSLATGQLFATEFTIEAQAVDTRGRRSGVEAFIKNPEPVEPLVAFTGLRPRGEPTFDAPAASVPAPADCPSGPDPDAGTLQFSRPEYVTDETVGAPFVLVTRTGGSGGAVSASVITSDGSAQAGADYTAISTTVRFEDGDTSPRLVEIPILPDDLPEGDESFDVSLLDPNCGAFGDQTTAEVTIAGIAVPPAPETFTIGGTVTGLEGSGLVLATLAADDLAVDANGPFEFTPPVVDGLNYDVSVVSEPNDPDQQCTVTNGAGRVSGADVTDVVVACSTLPPVSGLDLTFDGDGRASTSVPGGHAEAVVVQPDGMIVSAGGGIDFNLTRYDPDGILDESFGTGGIVTTNLGATDLAMDVALQPGDNKIVVVGKSGSDWAIARYLANGTPDADFGTGGVVKTDFNGGFDTANGVALDTQGRIVVAGHAQLSRGPGAGFQHDFAVARYTDDGEPDPLFGGGDGLVTTNLGTDTDLGNDVALDAQDRIVVAGPVDQEEGSAIVRYDSTGDVDTTFAGGPVITDLDHEAVFKGVAIRPDDGKIVLAGHADGDTACVSGCTDFALAMFDADGNLDTSIGDAGLVTTDVSPGQTFAEDFAKDLAIQTDGKIVLAGRNTSDTFQDLVIVRYTRDGVVDASFGGDGEGVLITDFHGSGDTGNDVALQPDGKIVAAVDAANGGSFALARALP